MVTRRQFVNLATVSVALAAATGTASSEPGYPAQPVRILVGFAAGGNFDLVARIIGQWLSDRFHQPVVVENRSGAAGNIATEAVIRASADGYTLLMGGAVNAVNATLYDKLPFNFSLDAAPVAGVVRFPNVLAVNPSFPANSVLEFIAHVRANPGKVNQGSSGTGTTQHLAGELLKMATGIEFAHIPYRGAAQAITDLLGGQVQFVFEPLPAALPFIKSGKLRALAVTTTARAEALPDVPALAEFVPGYEASGWTGIFAPRNTPAHVVTTLNETINAGLSDPAVRTRFADLGAMTMPGSHDQFEKFIAVETEKWAKVIRAGNIKAT